MPHDDSVTLPLVSVVMPVKNERLYIARSVSAVMNQDYPHDRYEVIIADGMSEDGTRPVLESLRAQYSNLVVIDNGRGIVATGLNLATKVARGEIIVRVDGHCEIARDYLSSCVRHIMNDKIDAVGGSVTTVGLTRTAMAIAAAMSSRFGVGGAAFRTMAGKTMPSDTVPFPAYKKSTISRAGDYDEEQVRNQDDEYNYRIRALGGTLLLAGDVRSLYYSRASFRSLGNQYFGYGFWKVRVLQKHPRQMMARQFVPPSFVLAVLLSALAGPFIHGALTAFGIISGSYLLAAFGAAFLSAFPKRVGMFHLFLVAFPVLHISYGIGFLVGMGVFWKRWFDP
jgi:glycosyltransferase involved in cell wall biosynthesis